MQSNESFGPVQTDSFFHCPAGLSCRPADPLFPGARDGQNLTSWRWSLPLHTDLVWWRSMHAISSYRGNRPTHKHRPPATDRTDYTLRC